MDRSRDEGLGSNVRCIASSIARSLQSRERAGRLLGRDVVRGNLSLRLPLMLEQDSRTQTCLVMDDGEEDALG